MESIAGKGGEHEVQKVPVRYGDGPSLPGWQIIRGYGNREEQALPRLPHRVVAMPQVLGAQCAHHQECHAHLRVAQTGPSTIVSQGG